MDAAHYIEYYSSQASQSGGGGQYFAGPTYQRGQGLGGIFRSIYNFIRPLFKPAAKFVGKRILNTGASILSDVAGGRNIKESAKERLTEAGSEIVDRAVDKVKSMRGGQALKRKLATKNVHFQLKRLKRQSRDFLS